MTTSGTTNDREWQGVVQRVTTSHNEWQWMTTSDNEWQRVAKNYNDNEWQQVIKRMKTNESNLIRVILCFKMKQKTNLVLAATVH